jgi:hypothetical protein
VVIDVWETERGTDLFPLAEIIFFKMVGHCTAMSARAGICAHGLKRLHSYLKPEDRYLSGSLRPADCRANLSCLIKKKYVLGEGIMGSMDLSFQCTAAQRLSNGYN